MYLHVNLKNKIKTRTETHNYFLKNRQATTIDLAA